MAERCELCGARWEVGASTCRDCGSRRRITVPPQESSASMSGMAIVRSALSSGVSPSASPSSSDIAMVRVDSSSAAIPAARDASGSGPANVPAARDGLGSAPVSAAAPPSPTGPFAVATSPSPTGPFAAAAPPSPAPSFPPPTLPSSAATLPPGVPTHVPSAFSQPLARPTSRRALLIGLGALAVAIGVGVWISTTRTAEPETSAAPATVHVGGKSSCEELAALAGSWVFTTATTGARRKERLGVRGFYELEITVDGCSARATLAKTGRTDNTTFDADKIPRAEAVLAQGEGFDSYGWSGTFVMRNDDGQGIDTRFVFGRDGERLVGSWRQLGERWTSSGLYGVLEGRRDGDPVAILPERATQPCAVRCATPEDITQLDTPSQAAHAACMASCK